MALRKTINELHHRDEDYKAIANDKIAFVQAWKDDINNLFDTIRSLLEEYTKDSSMIISEINYKVDEEALGEYRASALIMQIANREIILYPVARMAQRYSGILVMRRQDRVSQNDMVRIVRNIGEDIWHIQARDASDANNILRPFTTTLTNTLIQTHTYVQLYDQSLENALDFLLNL